MWSKGSKIPAWLHPSTVRSGLLKLQNCVFNKFFSNLAEDTRMCLYLFASLTGVYLKGSKLQSPCDLSLSVFPVANSAPDGQARTIMLLSLTTLIQFTLISRCLDAKGNKKDQISPVFQSIKKAHLTSAVSTGSQRTG